MPKVTHYFAAKFQFKSEFIWLQGLEKFLLFHAASSGKIQNTPQAYEAFYDTLNHSKWNEQLETLTEIQDLQCFHLESSTVIPSLVFK